MENVTQETAGWICWFSVKYAQTDWVRRCEPVFDDVLRDGRTPTHPDIPATFPLHCMSHTMLNINFQTWLNFSEWHTHVKYTHYNSQHDESKNINLIKSIRIKYSRNAYQRIKSGKLFPFSIVTGQTKLFFQTFPRWKMTKLSSILFRLRRNPVSSTFDVHELWITSPTVNVVSSAHRWKATREPKF